MSNSVLILNGPNLNMLGTREPEYYGAETLAQIEKRCRSIGAEIGWEIDFRQSNNEGELVTWVQESSNTFRAIILNAGAYTHTSIAIHDAVKASGVPVIEVHLSNIYRREEFRHTSYISGLADGVICGFGGVGYELALRALGTNKYS